MRTILVTGASGFVGRNLVQALQRVPETQTLSVDTQDSELTLNHYLEAADCVFHLAGVNRPGSEEELIEGNAHLTSRIVEALLRRKSAPLLAISSSIQAALDNPYGRSKRMAEEAVERYGKSGAAAAIFRLPNVFGKWSRPNYNSVVATFCHNISRGLAISVSDPNRVMRLVYIDDVVNAFLGLLSAPREQGVLYYSVEPVTEIALGSLVEEIQQIHRIRSSLRVPDISSRFRKALYATYLSFLPMDSFCYEPENREDARGALAELLKSESFGQLFVSRTRPGVTRGNHFHDTKVEKFCVLEGEAVVRFRQVDSRAVIEYPVSGRKFKIVDIPPGYTHNIENIGAGDLVVLFWSSQLFDPAKPDTYALPVTGS